MAPIDETRRLNEIIQFLGRNRKWNRDLQRASYNQALCNAKTPLSRLKSLLFSSVYSQSQPKLDLLCDFWRKLEAHKWPRATPTVESLVAALVGFLDNKQSGKRDDLHGEQWDRLFQVLRRQMGWGHKTAALFIKATINIHRSRDTRLHFLDFAGTILKSGDRLYLPVDAVIVQVFRELSFGGTNFSSINATLDAYSNEDILLWDDLWFWGFITQKSIKGKRKVEWNPAKFWALPFAPRSHEREIERQAGEFIGLIQRKRT